jgi:threonine aldolase
MEAALFLPSGTMCNEIAIAVHTRPGDEVICTRESHIIFAESGGPAALSGVMMCPIDGDRGMLTPEEVAAASAPARPMRRAAACWWPSRPPTSPAAPSGRWSS